MGEDNKDKSLYAAPKQEPIKEDETLITGAEALMRSLQAEGVKTIFGYPGCYQYPYGCCRCHDGFHTDGRYCRTGWYNGVGN